MSNLSRAGLFAGVLLLTTVSPVLAQSSSRAHVADRSATAVAAPTEIRVVNNHGLRVGVVLVDGNGHHESLGRVGNGAVRIFKLDSTAMASGTFRVKVFTDEPVWSPSNTADAIGSRRLSPRAGEAVTFWVEPDLTHSSVTVGS